jgi:transposase
MTSIGVDLHKRESQLAIRHSDGTTRDVRIRTTREHFTSALRETSQAKILLEASTESEWVAQHLEGLGHTVIVADPNFAPMYGHRTRRQKTDKRDARALLDACEKDLYRRAHRLSATQRHVRATLAVRDGLVRSRTRLIGLTKTLVRRDGLRVDSGGSTTVATRVRALDLPGLLEAELAPLLTVFDTLTEQIDQADAALRDVQGSDPLVRLLATAPGVGRITAIAFVATIDEVSRFRSAHELEAYLGLVPAELSSGEKRRIGKITKAGNSRMRWLLVEAAWRILRATKDEESAALRAWATKIATRRGKQIGAVALARRLAGILYAMWRDQTPYDPRKLRGPKPERRRPSLQEV